jgi:glutathionylspermidine synthase
MKVNDLWLEYLKADVEATVKLTKRMQLKEACNELHDLFEELIKAGFNETQAFTMITILLTTNK